MLSEDLQPKRGILSQRWEVWGYLGIMEGSYRWCGKKCVKERQRHWEMQRKGRDGGGTIQYNKEVG